jgi:hypothetical protein
MDFISVFQSLNWEPIVGIALQAVGLFSLIATQTSNAADNVIADFLLRVVNFLGGNFGKAKNSQ